MNKANSKQYQYRTIVESKGINFLDCLVLAFVFSTIGGPGVFHLQIMCDVRRPTYYVFDSFGCTAQVVIPKDDKTMEIMIELAKEAGGRKTTPNLI